MKILSAFVDGRVGGPQLRSLAVAGGLREQDVETEFMVPAGEGSFASRARAEGFSVHVPGYTSIGPIREVANNVQFSTTSIRSLPKVKALIDHRGIDIVHNNVSVNIFNGLAANISGASVVWQFNDTLMPWPVTKLSSQIAGWLADEIVITSSSVGEHYFPGCHEGFRRLYPPVDTKKFDRNAVSSSGLRSELNGTSESIVIGTIGNLNPVKGHEFLLKAIPDVANAVDVPVTVLIVGTKLKSRSNYFKRLKKMASDLRGNIDVQFLGQRSDIAELLCLFDVFVLSSISESGPMVVLEAMAMQRPVVTTNVGVVREEIEDGEQAWVVPAKRPQAMAKAILEALSHPVETKRRGRKARQKVKDTFSLERCVHAHEELYASL